ncbi:hypothetical protein TNCV_1886371 [Trichonephila clavipes]|nr:hypothetical protein TNCV_1886371 [Trichonephila clavipes]
MMIDGVTSEVKRLSGGVTSSRRGAGAESPKREPCVTPMLTRCVIESVSFTLTLYFLLVSIASKASSGEFLLQSQKQLKVTWCEIRTMILALPVKSCNMVLRCRQRVWSRIVIQQQKARFEKPGHFFPNLSLQF